MRKNDENKSAGNKLVYSVLYGAAVGFLFVLILFAVFSAIIASGKASDNLMPYLTALSSLLGGVLGAVIAVRLYRGKLLLVGLGVGAVMFLVTFICSLFSGGKVAGGMTFILLVTFLAGGVAGSFVSLKKKRRKHT